MKKSLLFFLCFFSYIAKSSIRKEDNERIYWKSTLLDKKYKNKQYNIARHSAEILFKTAQRNIVFVNERQLNTFKNTDKTVYESSILKNPKNKRIEIEIKKVTNNKISKHLKKSFPRAKLIDEAYRLTLYEFFYGKKYVKNNRINLKKESKEKTKKYNRYSKKSKKRRKRRKDSNSPEKENKNSSIKTKKPRIKKAKKKLIKIKKTEKPNLKKESYSITDRKEALKITQNDPSKPYSRKDEPTQLKEEDPISTKTYKAPPDEKISFESPEPEKKKLPIVERLFQSKNKLFTSLAASVSNTQVQRIISTENQFFLSELRVDLFREKRKISSSSAIHTQLEFKMVQSENKYKTPLMINSEFSYHQLNLVGPLFIGAGLKLDNNFFVGLVKRGDPIGRMDLRTFWLSGHAGLQGRILKRWYFLQVGYSRSLYSFAKNLDSEFAREIGGNQVFARYFQRIYWKILLESFFRWTNFSHTGNSGEFKTKSFEYGIGVGILW